jgi:hypothetical protein
MRSAPGFPGRHPAARTRQASRRGGPQRHRLQDRRARLHRGAAAPGRDVGEPVRRARSTSLRAACGHGRSYRSRSSSAGFVSASVTATETWLSGRICVPFATCARRIVAGCWVIRWAICTSRIVPRRRRAGGFSRTYRGRPKTAPRAPRNLLRASRGRKMSPDVSPTSCSVPRRLQANRLLPREADAEIRTPDPLLTRQAL